MRIASPREVFSVRVHRVERLPIHPMSPSLSREAEEASVPTLSDITLCRRGSVPECGTLGELDDVPVGIVEVDGPVAVAEVLTLDRITE